MGLPSEPAAAPPPSSTAWGPPSEPPRSRRATALAVLKRYFDEDGRTLAGGIALFALTAIPALIVAFVALYGLLSSPRAVWGHVDWLSRFLPAEVTSFLRGQMQFAAASSRGSLGVTAAIGILLALIGTGQAVSATMQALNRIYRVPECRSFLRRSALALAFTIGGMVLALGALLGLVALPSLAGALGWESAAWAIIRQARWPAAFALVALLLATFYRVAPCRARVRWGAAVFGATIAAVIWVAASLVLSWYATQVVDYARLYGAAGGFVVILLWFYFGGTAVLVGGLSSAEADAHLRRIRRKDGP